jgi:hypothetical protein
LHKVLDSKSRHRKKAAHVECPRFIKSLPIDVVDGEVSVGTVTMDVPPVLTADIDNKSARRRISRGGFHERSFNTQLLQILPDEPPKEVFTHFAQHAGTAAQTFQISRSVRRASTHTDQIPVNETQLSGCRERVKAAPEYVRNE